MRKLNVGVIFGSRSVEHEVSIITARQIMEGLDRQKYNIIPVYITKEGKWLVCKDLPSLDMFKDLPKALSQFEKAFIVPDSSTHSLVKHPDSGGWFRKVLPIQMDVVIPSVHGTYGEDGTLQGLLELADIPYVGARVLGSAVGMDKIIMKSIFRDNGLPIVDYLWFLRKEWESQPETVIERIETDLKYPLFIKPANLGSSVGITKANNKEDLRFGIDVASHYDRRLIVEQGMEHSVEINCSVLGNDDPIASVCEQPIHWQEFLNYEDKYLRKNRGEEARRIPAPISSELTEKIQRLAIKAFKVIDCCGIARIDFLVHQKDEKPFVNEINTIPGAFSFYLWDATGIPISQLADRLIQLAFEVHEEKKKTSYSFDSNVMGELDLASIKIG